MGLHIPHEKTATTVCHSPELALNVQLNHIFSMTDEFLYLDAEANLTTNFMALGMDDFCSSFGVLSSRSDSTKPIKKCLISQLK